MIFHENLVFRPFDGTVPSSGDVDLLHSLEKIVIFFLKHGVMTPYDMLMK